MSLLPSVGGSSALLALRVLPAALNGSLRSINLLARVSAAWGWPGRGASGPQVHCLQHVTHLLAPCAQGSGASSSPHSLWKFGYSSNAGDGKEGGGPAAAAAGAAEGAAAGEQAEQQPQGEQQLSLEELQTANAALQAELEEERKKVGGVVDKGARLAVAGVG